MAKHMGLQILKTYKIFIGGVFPRTESGRYYKLQNANKQVIANVCLSSRKDFRNAVVAARKAQEGWQGRAAFNRAQIIYRIAEIMDCRRAQFIDEMVQQGYTRSAATKEFQLCIDACVHFSGWCDKYQAVTSSVNPVATPHFNFSAPEPMGVVSIICNQKSALLNLVVSVLSCIVGGNTCVVLAAQQYPLNAITFAEVLATSDVPGGVVNILTGKQDELYTHMSNHMDVNAIVYCGNDEAIYKKIAELSAGNVKRSFNWQYDDAFFATNSLTQIMHLQEIKTTWHPVEVIGVSGTKY